MTFTATHEPPSDSTSVPSEAETLRSEAEAAKAAMVACALRMQRNLKNTASLGAWTRRHPWWVTGIAVGAGFLAARAIVPAKSEEADSDSDSESNGAAPSVVAAAISQSIAALRPMVEQTAQQWFAQINARRAAEESENGDCAANIDQCDEFAQDAASDQVAS